jgi:pimeloyl-ACP methyl ester carboxylesterase
MLHFQTWQQGAPNAPILIFIPGFLSETSQATDIHTWRKGIRRFTRNKPFTCADLVWESESFFSALTPLLNIHSDPTEMLKVWGNAKSKAHETAAALATKLREMQRCVHIVGHSLGATIGLNAAAQLARSSTKLQSLTLMAPAVRQSEFPAQDIAAGVQTKPTIFYSRRDMTLMCLFGLASAPDVVKSRNALNYINQILSSRLQDPAVGVAGYQSQDASQHDVTPLLHFQYAPKVANILEMSNIQ